MASRQRYDASYHFKRELEEQGCGCLCNAFCWANFWLLLWLFLNLLLLLWFALMVYALHSDYGAVEWDCDSNSDGIMESCDAREVLEDYGITKGASIAYLVLQFIIIILNILGFVGLWQCIPWMILIIIIMAVCG
eukprot:122716_1